MTELFAAYHRPDMIEWCAAGVDDLMVHIMASFHPYADIADVLLFIFCSPQVR